VTAGSSCRSSAAVGSCIGEHFAMLETTLALATIVRAVEIRSLDDDFPVEVPFTTVAKGPIRAHIEARR
jgi:cytochrome P450